MVKFMLLAAVVVFVPLIYWLGKKYICPHCRGFMIYDEYESKLQRCNSCGYTRYNGEEW